MKISKLKRRIYLCFIMLMSIMLLVGCGEKEPKGRIDPATVKKSILASGTDLNGLREGEYYVFDAVFWTTRNDKKYSYAFSCNLEGEEYAKSIFVQDGTGGKLGFLKDYSYSDEKSVRLTAQYKGVEKDEKQDHYLFYCIAAAKDATESINLLEGELPEKNAGKEEDLVFTDIELVADLKSSEGPENEPESTEPVQTLQEEPSSSANKEKNAEEISLEGAYILEAQAEGYGYITEVYIPSYDGMAYYLEFGMADENGLEHTISGFIYDSEPYYMFQEEECDNLQFCITVLEPGQIKFECLEAVSDVELYLGYIYGGTTWKWIASIEDVLNQ